MTETSVWKNWTPGEHSYYRKKVIDLEAFRFGVENEPGWLEDAVKAGKIEPSNSTGKLIIHTPSGDQNVWNGDWVVKGHKPGDYYAVHHDIFMDLYEPTPIYAHIQTP